MNKINIYLGILLGAGLFLLLDGSLLGAEGADTSNPCTLWGTGNEITTYQQPYCPVNAPEIPLREPKKGDSNVAKNPEFPDPFPTSPETAIAVIDSNGNRYCYYYTKMIRYRLQGDPPVCVPVWALVRVIMPYCPPKELTPGAALPPEPSPSGASLQFRTLVVP
ncbi:MAG: hypothetical protein Q4G69_04385 [Planctomycetia bacterium]|nr:hypothetical protein [Planctomycetia bacterium]